MPPGPKQVPLGTQRALKGTYLPGFKELVFYVAGVFAGPGSWNGLKMSACGEPRRPISHHFYNFQNVCFILFTLTYIHPGGPNTLKGVYGPYMGSYSPHGPRGLAAFGSIRLGLLIGSPLPVTVKDWAR